MDTGLCMGTHTESGVMNAEELREKRIRNSKTSFHGEVKQNSKIKAQNTDIHRHQALPFVLVIFSCPVLKKAHKAPPLARCNQEAVMRRGFPASVL